MLAVLSLTHSAHGQPPLLPAPVALALKHHGLPTKGLSIYVHEIGKAEPVLAVDADTPRNPASTMKLLTTLAALEELGPAYTWKTEVYADGAIANGRLDGDLFLKGYGDPYLVIEHFWRLLRALRNDGLHTIAGDLAIDQSYFAPEPEDPADFDARPTRAYNVLPQALLVNFQAVHFRFLPQQKGVRIVADPPLLIDNRLKMEPGPCRTGGNDINVRAPASGGGKVIVSGHYAATCGEREMFRVVAEPAPYIYGVFKALWAEQGGVLAGAAREKTTTPQATLLHTAYSPPLADVIRSINKHSNNVMTRQLLLTLGAEQLGAPGTTEKGIHVLRAWLRKRNLDFPELVLTNGAGLSRAERISARHLGELLLAAYASPYMPEFISSLPISSMDGTLKRRFGQDLEGRLHLKTGSLNGVRTMAGFVLDSAGRRLVVVYLHNHTRLGSTAADAVQQALLEWIYRRPAVASDRDDRSFRNGPGPEVATK